MLRLAASFGVLATASSAGGLAPPIAPVAANSFAFAVPTAVVVADADLVDDGVYILEGTDLDLTAAPLADISDGEATATGPSAAASARTDTVVLGDARSTEGSAATRVARAPGSRAPASDQPVPPAQPSTRRASCVFLRPPNVAKRFP